MVYDCFTFFNELDLLEIRLHVLNEVVDRFVLVEGTRTFTGTPKPLIYRENEARYQAFRSKIVHVVVDDFPSCDLGDPASPWLFENHQRNAIIRGLQEIRDQDVVIFSDVDEIPNPEAIRRYAHTPGIKCLEQMMFNYFLNYFCVTHGPWRLGSKMMTYGDFQHRWNEYAIRFNMFVPAALNQGATVNRIRHLEDAVRIPNGGWHFSFLGGWEGIQKKVQSFAHSELNSPRLLSHEELERRIRKGEGIYRRNERLFAVPLDERFPAYVRENQERYAHLIYAATPEYMRKTRWQRAFISGYGRFIRAIEFTLIPPSVHWRLSCLKNNLLRRRKVE